MTIEQYYDNLYERAESVNENEPTECHECDGYGNWSDCCGASINDYTCTDCNEVCKPVTCHVCKGAGVIND